MSSEVLSLAIFAASPPSDTGEKVCLRSLPWKFNSLYPCGRLPHTAEVTISIGPGGKSSVLIHKVSF